MLIIGVCNVIAINSLLHDFTSSSHFTYQLNRSKQINQQFRSAAVDEAHVLK